MTVVGVVMGVALVSGGALGCGSEREIKSREALNNAWTCRIQKALDDMPKGPSPSPHGGGMEAVVVGWRCGVVVGWKCSVVE